MTDKPRHDTWCSKLLKLETVGKCSDATKVMPTGAALLDNNETTAKSTIQDGGMAGNFS